jgi:hypothetical protein
VRSRTHEDYSRREELRVPSDRSVGIVFAAFFAAVAVWPLLSSRPFRLWAAVAAAAFLGAVLLFPSVLHPLNRIWTALGLAIGRVIEPVVTTVLYFAVFTPWGLLLRALGKDLLQLRYDSRASSYWIPRKPPGPPPETMSNQF